MNDATAERVQPAKTRQARLLPLVLALGLGGIGFASTFLGVWSPMAMLGAPMAMPAADAAPMAPIVEFVSVPTIEMPLPGNGGRTVVIAAMIETDAASKADVTHLMPRVSDSFNGFLSEVDPAALSRRGVLEIIRAELLNRTQTVLGETPVHDLLITEFRFK